MTTHDPGRLARRSRSVGAVVLGALVSVLLAPAWVPLVVLADLVRLKWRLPLLRLAAFGVAWLWLEVAGVTAATGLWLIGRSQDHRAHYALQRWWVTRLTRALRATTGVRFEATGTQALLPGPVIVLCRHASLADAVGAAWLITEAGMQPHFVLKKELLAVPNLDIVGNRLPNVFLDRSAPSGDADLDALRQAVTRIGADDALIIFPEGGLATPKRRQDALDRLAESNPGRADRLNGLRHLSPPRPAGTLALLDARPNADVAIVGHVGLDGLTGLGGFLRRVESSPDPVRFWVTRIPRTALPGDDQRADWLDQTWLTLDREVQAASRSNSTHQPQETP